MSTRRARIKAVASLPVRRKNVDTSDNKTKVEILSKSTENVANHKTDHETCEEQSKSVSQMIDKHNVLSISKENVTKENSILSPESRNSQKIPHDYVNGFQNAKTKTPIQLDFKQQLNVLSEVSISSSIIVDENITTVTNGSRNTPSYGNNISITGKQNTPTDLFCGITQPLSAPGSNAPDTSADEGDGVDGIIPLQSTRKVPKPIDILKNELISENAEVLFDPIVPLPSPNKVRPKLRPAPRLAPLRRNSIQGSASESEDESRRTLVSGIPSGLAPRMRHNSQTSVSTQHTLHSRETSRVRSESVCSTVSQSVTQSAPPTSPVKEKHLLTKSRRIDSSRRMTALRRRQRAREGVPRDALTMYDLIFYNPTTNPIVPDKDEENAQKEEAEVVQPKDVVEPPPQPEEETAVPVPQIKLGPDGQIMLDEKSLVIERTDSSRQLSGGVVHEGEWSAGGKGKYSRAARTADWSDAETVRFYRALAALGTDFTLMAPLFPDRSRRDLKIKFKKEERMNTALVDKALRSQVQWDAARLEGEFAQERREAAERTRKEREQLIHLRREERAQVKASRSMGIKIGKAAKALEILPSFNQETSRNTITSADDIIALAARPSGRRSRGIPRHQEKRDQPKSQPCLKSKPYIIVSPLNTMPAPQQRTTPVPVIPFNNPLAQPITHVNETRTLDMSTVTKLSIQPNFLKTVVPANVNPIEALPANIEVGSLVVLTTNDPNHPSKKVLQTYMSDAAGKITPVSIPAHVLSTVVSYMNKSGASISSAQGPSPKLIQGNKSTSPGVMVQPGQNKRPRLDSYNITQL